MGERLAHILAVVASGLAFAAAASPPGAGEPPGGGAGRTAAALDAIDRAGEAARAGELDRAEALMELAAVRGGRALIPYRDFVEGHVAWQRALAAAKIAALAEAGVPEWDAAVNQARRALDAWKACAKALPEPDAAARNAERAFRLLQAFERERQKALDSRQTATPPPAPGDEGAAAPEEGGDPFAVEDPGATPTRSLLNPAEVAAIWEKLEEKEASKRAVRQAGRDRARPPGGRDW